MMRCDASFRRLYMTCMAGMAVALALVVAGCGGGNDVPKIAPVEFTVVTSDLLVYEPNEISVEVGLPVKINLDNSSSSTPHDLSIDQIDVDDVDIVEPESIINHEHGSHLDLHVMFNAGEHGSITFTPKEAGTYEFYCTVPGHREAGMSGTLIVR